MAEQTGIEWCDSTFNPWIGCTKVSPACDHCYAAVSTPARTLGIEWGAGQPRRRTAASNWRQVLTWNAQHDVFFAEHGRRRRVFCASLADVFDNEVVPNWRAELLSLIGKTPNLDWLLLTKRIGNALPMLEAAMRNLSGNQIGWDEENRLPNVWIGSTICNQAEADRDIPKLARVPAAVRFLSMEPLLEQVSIEKWLDPWTCSNCGFHGSEADTGVCLCADCDVEAVYDEKIGSARCPGCDKDDGTSDDVGGTCPNCKSVRAWSRDYGFKFDSEKRLIDWVIVGGESGAQARPMHPQWARDLRDQCALADTPFLFKQWGEWLPICEMASGQCDALYRSNRKAREDEDQSELDESYGTTCTVALGILQLDGRLLTLLQPNAFGPGAMSVYKVGKKAAGRRLGGMTHDGVPA